MDLQIFYEDGHLAVIYKRAGIAVHPGPHEIRENMLPNRSSLPYELSVHQSDSKLQKVFLIQDIMDRWSNLPGPPERPGIVHRLDRDTEGLMIIARSEEAYESLVRSFATRQIQKRYIAWTYGFTPAQRHFGKVQTGISRDPKKRLRMVVAKSGKSAETTYRVLSMKKTRTGLRFYKVLLSPKTGRTHQLRVHLAYLGIPVVNDPWYAPKHVRKKRLRGLPLQKKANDLGLLLQARRLKFYHPIQKKMCLDFSAPYPKRFQEFDEIVNEC